MSCPKCAPVCKCYNALDPDWRHKDDCEWLLSRVQSISVQVYQAETFKEWLRLGLRVLHLPVGWTIPLPWNIDSWRPIYEGERHPLYKSFKAVRLLYGMLQWQWDPKSQHEAEEEKTEPTEVPRVDKDP